MKKFPLIIFPLITILGIRDEYENCTITIPGLTMKKSTEILRNTLFSNVQALQ